MSEMKPGKSLWSLWLDDLLALGVLGVLVGTLFSLLGRFWWVADLASHFTVYYALAGGGLFIVAVLMRCRIRVGLALLVLIVNGLLVWPVFMPMTPPDATGSEVLKLVQMNVLHMNRDKRRVGDFLRGCDADFVMVQEVDPWWDRTLREMDTPFSMAESQPRDGSFGMALLVREKLGDDAAITLLGTRVLDMADGFDGDERPSIEVTLLLEGRRVRVLGIHPPPPVSARTTALRDSVLRYAKQWADEQSDPHIVIGDLNTTPWSYAFSILAGDGQLSSTQNGYGNQGTWPTRLPMPLLLPIDHCLISGEWLCTGRRIGEETGSDHRPLVVSLALRADSQARSAIPLDGPLVPAEGLSSIHEDIPAGPATIPR